jgi:hypothetical protein
MTHASITSWKTIPPPNQREPLGFSALFTDAEAAALRQGLIPREMEDKWFIGVHEGWLLFHRSWTGACIYGLRLEWSPAGARVVDSWANRDPNQYQGTDIEYDRKLVRFLIDAFLLRRPGCVFPMPPDVGQVPPRLIQHAFVGRAFPESAPGTSPRAKDD